MTSRSLGRNLHIYGARDTSTVLGGLVVTSGMTNSNFYSMVEITYTLGKRYTLRYEGGTIVPRDDCPLQRGKYIISIQSPLIANKAPWPVPLGNVPPETSNTESHDAAHQRDRGCVITGEHAINEVHGFRDDSEATHIVPLDHEQHSVDNGNDLWITIPTSRGSRSSVQKGVLLGKDIHQRFERYLLSINPDDNYKIVCFVRDNADIAGKHLDKTFLKNPQRPGDQFLRWHFRQAVLANMKGQGEPIFEQDFPSGCDMVGEIMSGLKAGEGMNLSPSVD